MGVYEGETVTLDERLAGGCALVQDLLPLYLDGEVSAASRELIGAHLAGCARCAAFLAGAQSVRSELHRDLAQYHRLRGADQAPAPRPRRWHQMLLGTVALLICVIGGLASMLVAYGLDGGSPFGLLVGGVVGTSALAALLLLARVLAPLSPLRLWRLLAAVGTGTAAGFVAIYGESLARGASAMLALVAMGMAAGAVAAASGADEPARAP